MTGSVVAQTLGGGLPGALADAVRDLAERSAAADGVAALSEATLIGLDAEDRRHVTVARGDGDEGAATPLAYAQLWVDGSVELVVDPAHRRHGLGRTAFDAAVVLGAERFWAHGDLPAARAAAAAWGLRSVRELRHMARPLTAADASDAALPEGYRVRTFVPGSDDEAWLRTNARAFAGHPEQGRVGQRDLDALVAQPWFDPAGFFVVENEASPAGRIAAFHWTKHVPGTDEGEVFVVGIDPDHQGRGLAGPLTRIGLAHLAGLGLRTVDLYVDGGNERAVRTYERLGFETGAVDVVYA